MTNNLFKKKRANWPTKAEDSIPLTADTIAALKREQAELLREQDEVIERLKVAREMGDLSENGAYKYAKFELGRVRRRLGDVNKLLKLGVVIKKQQNGQAGFGNQVTVKNQQGERSFLLVSEHESDPVKGKLSDKSPLGAAVFGRSTGDKILVELPGGQTEFEITAIN